MVVSKSRNDNFLNYLILEIILLSVVTLLGVGLVVFYSTGKSDVRTKSNNLEYLFDNPLIFTTICLIPVFLSVSFIIFFRTRNYIVGYEFDTESKIVTLLYRGILSKKNNEISLKFDDFTIDSFFEKKILFNQTYKGIRIQVKEKLFNLDFVSNNFIWENQVKDKFEFLKRMEIISEQKITST